MTAAYRNDGKKRSDARRTRGEGVPPKSAAAPSIGAEREVNIAQQTKQRNALEKRGSHAKRRTALADARRRSAVSVSARRSFLDDMRTHCQPQSRGRARPNCRGLAETTMRRPIRSAFCQLDPKPQPNPSDTSPPSPTPPPDEPDIDPPAGPIRRELHHVR
jgi:hypothetical protein